VPDSNRIKPVCKFFFDKIKKSSNQKYSMENSMVYARLYYHLVWSTKNREPVITQEMESELFPYLMNKSKNLECRIIIVNAYLDHIHLIIEIPSKFSIAHIVKELKGSSSFDFQELYWQRGYGVLTISERNLNAAIEYVKKQKEHHRQNKTFDRYELYNKEDLSGSKKINEPKANYETIDDQPF
jgi:putative transposase